jgi:hypothetical protein
MKPKNKHPQSFLISELNTMQRNHLAWRLDHNTVCGYLTACHIARGEGEYGRSTLFDIFRSFDKSPHSAKILSCKVVRFVPKG